jgi:hypothetical protein
MDKKETIDYLRKNQGFSKRLSTKIVGTKDREQRIY